MWNGENYIMSALTEFVLFSLQFWGGYMKDYMGGRCRKLKEIRYASKMLVIVPLRKRVFRR